MFQVTTPPDILNTSTNLMFTEYSNRGKTFVFCETQVFLNFSTYSIDTSQPSGLNLVNMEIQSKDPSAIPIFIHPDWMLAGWSVDRGGTVASSRVSSKQMASSLNSSLVAYETADPKGVAGAVGTIHSAVLHLTLTLVDYYSTPEPPSILADPSRPHLKAFARAQLWSYGFESRTSRLGAFVVIAGCILVVAQTCVGLVMRTPRKSAVQFVAIALKQEPVEKFAILNEKQMGRERLVLKDDTRYVLPKSRGHLQPLF
jgi:hypothetical protein